jgi:membrane protein DedA with SNARE-associated domain
MADLLLDRMTSLGPVVLGLAMLPAAIGLPVPAGVLLVAAGACVRSGAMDWKTTVLAAWLGATMSDSATYAIGRRMQHWAAGRLAERRAGLWLRAKDLFLGHPGWAICTTGVLARGLSNPTNLIAGSSGYPFARFLAWDAAGKLAWIALYFGLGFAFASEWQLMGGALSRYTTWLAVAVAGGVAVRRLVYRPDAGQREAVPKAAKG